MNPILVATAVTVVAGAIVAISSREARVALLGLALTLIGAPLLADPFPAPLPLAARVIGAVLATELLWVAVRATTGLTRGSLVGWPVEALAAIAAFVVGLGVADAIGSPTVGAIGGAGGAQVILGAAFALMTLAVAPLVFGRDILRLGIAATLLVAGASVLEAALVGPPSSLQQLVIAGVTVGLGLGVAAACGNAFVARGDLSLGGIRPREAVPGMPAGQQARPRSDERS